MNTAVSNTTIISTFLFQLVHNICHHLLIERLAAVNKVVDVKTLVDCREF